MTSPFRCEDCNGPITGTVGENAALAAGIRLCISCIESMEDERDAYEQERREAGVECVFDPERGFVMRRLIVESLDRPHGG